MAGSNEELACNQEKDRKLVFDPLDKKNFQLGQHKSRRRHTRMIKPKRNWRARTDIKLHLAGVLLLLLANQLAADSLRFTSIQMPALVQRGTNFWLSCQYELSSSSSASSRGGGGGSSDEQLYSVKWYRNNEEFYRLIFGNGGGGGQSSHSQQQPSGDQLSAPQQQQQQYFSQTGVNVLMSSSNATHVRLLNASLESDGSYACEISTQNLSTIRHEKEIKVYVLPHLKLNLIGLKSVYALGDRVELNCLSDFSRPSGAIAWFIRGQQITRAKEAAQQQQQQQANSLQHHFELAASTKHKASEPKLTRSSLVLKFKLTNELLATFAATWPSAFAGNYPLDDKSAAAASKRRASTNQSRLMLMKSLSATGKQQQQQQTAAVPTNSGPLNSGRDETKHQDEDEAAAGAQMFSRESLLAAGPRLFELLKLECRYKLAEVSDVTFNELRVASSTSLAAAAASSSADDETSELPPLPLQHQTGSVRNRPSTAPPPLDSPDEQFRKRRRRSSVAYTNRGKGFKLTKSHAGSQVIQSQCPAQRGALLLATAPLNNSSAQLGNACQLGLLALQRDDPVILEPQAEQHEKASEEVYEDAEARRREESTSEATSGQQHQQQQNHHLELPIGSSLSVNCSTLGAVTTFGAAQESRPNRQRHHWRLTPHSSANFLRNNNNNNSTLQLNHNERARAQDDDDDEYDDDNERRQSASASVYCSDPVARRRLLVSGRSTLTTTPALAASTEQEWQQRSRLNPSSSNSAMIAQQQQQQQQQTQRRHHVAYVDLAAAATAITTRRPQRELGSGGGDDGGGAPDDKLSLSSLVPAESSNAHRSAQFALGPSGARKSLGQLHRATSKSANNNGDNENNNNNNNNKDQWQGDETTVAAIVAPPLLEWFINNQEAPRSSARYTPELPLQEPSGGHVAFAAATNDDDDPRSQPLLESKALGGATGDRVLNSPTEDGAPSPSLPSIDYVEYFANFNQRPIDQHLMLQLTLEKRHFMTPDSLLKLRCTSTQAQVLAFDSLTVGLIALPAGKSNHIISTQQQYQQQQHQQSAQSSWQQRALPSGGGNSQIKSKYLHQYHARPSGQQRNRGIVAPTGANQDQQYQLASEARANESNGSSGSSTLLTASRLVMPSTLTALAVLFVVIGRCCCCPLFNQFVIVQ